jgi:hypothetical protein
METQELEDAAQNSAAFLNLETTIDELRGVTSKKIFEVEEGKAEEEVCHAADARAAVVPDAETQSLIADVIRNADEFKIQHKKLRTLVDPIKIMLLKAKFGVRQGCAGHALLIGGLEMMWDAFVIRHYDCTTTRINQLLNLKDAKDEAPTFKLPDEDKALGCRGGSRLPARIQSCTVRFARWRVRQHCTGVQPARERFSSKRQFGLDGCRRHRSIRNLGAQPRSQREEGFEGIILGILKTEAAHDLGRRASKEVRIDQLESERRVLGAAGDQ